MVPPSPPAPTPLSGHPLPFLTQYLKKFLRLLRSGVIERCMMAQIGTIFAFHREIIPNIIFDLFLTQNCKNLLRQLRSGGVERCMMAQIGTIFRLIVKSFQI